MSAERKLIFEAFALRVREHVGNRPIRTRDVIEILFESNEEWTETVNDWCNDEFLSSRKIRTVLDTRRGVVKYDDDDEKNNEGSRHTYGDVLYRKLKGYKDELKSNYLTAVLNAVRTDLVKLQDFDVPTEKQESLEILNVFAPVLSNPRKIVGRRKEMTRLFDVMRRMSKNNAVLLGNPGVGKTRIVEGLAHELKNNDDSVPNSLRGKELRVLDLTKLISGTANRGDFEKRLKSLVEALSKTENVIMFIDEMHTLMGAGKPSGGVLDASNALKSVLAENKKFTVIGASTQKEWDEHVVPDDAFTRRFQTVLVEEPSEEECVLMLKEDVVPWLNEWHFDNQGTISDQTIRIAVYLGKRFVSRRYLPDSAIDLLDEACARCVRLNGPRHVTSEHVRGVTMEWMGLREFQTVDEMSDKISSFVPFRSDSALVVSKAVATYWYSLLSMKRPVGCFELIGDTSDTFVEAIDRVFFPEKSRLIRINLNYERHTTPFKVADDWLKKHSFCIICFSNPNKAFYDALNEIAEHGVVSEMCKESYANALVFVKFERDDDRMETNDGRLHTFVQLKENTINRNDDRTITVDDWNTLINTKFAETMLTRLLDQTKDAVVQRRLIEGLTVEFLVNLPIKKTLNGLNSAVDELCRETAYALNIFDTSQDSQRGVQHQVEGNDITNEYNITVTNNAVVFHTNNANVIAA